MATTNSRTQIRIKYSTQATGFPAINHVHALYVNFLGEPLAGTPFNSINVRSQDGNDINLLTWLTIEYLPLIQPMYNTTTSFNLVELWHYPANSDNAYFVSAYTLGLLGTSANPTYVSGYVIETFRTVNGNTLKLAFMETVIETDVQDLFPIQNSVANAIATHVVADDSPIVGKRDTLPIAPIGAFYGRNEALWRKRYRNT